MKKKIPAYLAISLYTCVLEPGRPSSVGSSIFSFLSSSLLVYASNKYKKYSTNILITEKSLQTSIAILLLGNPALPRTPLSTLIPEHCSKSRFGRDGFRICCPSLKPHNNQSISQSDAWFCSPTHRLQARSRRFSDAPRVGQRFFSLLRSSASSVSTPGLRVHRTCSVRFPPPPL